MARLNLTETQIDYRWYEDPCSLLGEVLGGLLQLDTVLGYGGYAVTYRARDLSSPLDERFVVVKLFYIRPNEDKVEKIRRLIMEKAAHDALGNAASFVTQVMPGRIPARRPEQIDSITANRIYQRMVAGEQYYLVLQYMSRGSLWDKIGRAPLNIVESVKIIRQMCMAVAYAHSKGILHRDIKPENVVFDEQGNARLVDFGTAYFLDMALPQAQTSVRFANSYYVGTPGYIPPEIVRGYDDTVQRDVYALGVTLVEMLTGPLRPSHPITIESCRTALEAQIAQIEHAGLRAVAQRATAPSMQSRYADVAEMAAVLATDLRPAAPPIVNQIVLLDSAETNRHATPRASWLPSLATYQQRTPVAFMLWLTTAAIFAQWPDFWGTTLTYLLPAIAGMLALFAPLLATVTALLLIASLMSALWLPISLSLLALIGALLTTARSTQKRDTLRSLWLVGSILPLAGWYLSLAVPLTFARSDRPIWQRLALASTSYGVLFIWGTLTGLWAVGGTAVLNGADNWSVAFVAADLLDSAAYLLMLSTVAEFGRTLLSAAYPLPIIQLAIWLIITLIATDNVRARWESLLITLIAFSTLQTAWLFAFGLIALDQFALIFLPSAIATALAYGVSTCLKSHQPS